MKIDFSQLVAIRGVPVTLEQDKQATLGVVARTALNNMPPDTRLQLEASLKRGRLSLKVAEEGDQDLSPEEVSLIRSALVVFTNPELITVAHDMLDPKDAAESI